MKPKEIGIFHTKTHMSELIEQVEQGQTFYITKRGRRVAELRPAPLDREPLVRGCAKNAGYFMSADFDEALGDFEEHL